MPNRMIARFLSLMLPLGLLLGGCSTVNDAAKRTLTKLTPYKVNVVQGNFISQEAVAQLRPGMSRDEVRMLLGTPLVADAFHDNRWDYVFVWRRGNENVVRERRFTVHFDGDRVTRFEGDKLPTEYELIAEIDGQKVTSR